MTYLSGNIRRAENDIRKKLTTAIDFIENFNKIKNKEYEFSDVNIINVLNTLIRGHQKAFDKKGIYIHDEYSKTIGKIIWFTSEVDLQRVLNLILENVQKYAEPRYGFTVTLQDDMLILKNDAPPDPTVTEQTIFRKGFRGENARKMKTAGKGQGLHFARNLCDAAGLEIRFVQEPTYAGPHRSTYRFSISPRRGS